MKDLLFAVLASVLLFSTSALSQETRGEISVQGTGFFTKEATGNGISRTTTKTGGLLVGYRHHLNRWLSAEANYGFDRNTQKYFSPAGFAGVQSDVHAVTADTVVNLPISISRGVGSEIHVLPGEDKITFTDEFGDSLQAPILNKTSPITGSNE